MNYIATVRRIENGFIMEYEGREHFLSDFNFAAVLEAAIKPSHDEVVEKLVLSFPEGSGKIPPIKAVREYCIKNDFDKYRGLKEAKDYVESLRSDDYWRGYRC